jgi:signal transduction histidine kinase/PAS domain-containing protein
MRYVTLILFSLLVLVGWTRTHAQAGDVDKPEPVIITSEQDRYPLGLHMEILEDPGGELAIEDVASPEFDSRFTTSQVEVPNYGFTDSAYWVQLRLRNESPATERLLLELANPNMHFVDLFTPLADGAGFEVTRTGALRPPADRDILHPHIVFNLAVPALSEQTFYLRFKNGASMTLPLTLWEPATFFADSFREQIWQGVFLGLMAGLLSYNLFLLFSLRDVSYLYLVLLLSGIILYDVSQTGLLEVYIAPSLYYLKIHLIPLAMVLIFIPLILFNDSFVSAKMLLPKIHLLNITFAGLWVVLGLMTFLISYHNLATVISPSIVITIVVAAVTVVIAWRMGFRAARLLLIAWAGLLAGILLFILTRMGIISSNLLTENIYRFAFSWMAVCWSIALADRINLLKAETESANRNLRSSEFRLSQTLEAMPVGVVVYGVDQRPTFINKRTAEILSNPDRGLGPDPSHERTLTEAMSYYSFRITGSDQAYPLEKFPVYRALQGEPTSIDDVEADLVDWRVPLEVWSSPVFDNEGNVESAVIAFQDVSVRKRQDAELDKYRRQLEQLVQERTEELNATNEQLTNEVAERAVLERLLHKRILWMSTLNLTRQKISGAADLPEAFAELFEAILQLLDAGSVFLVFWDGRDEQGEFLCRLTHEGPVPDSEAVRTSFQKDSPLRRELELGQTLIFSVDQIATLPVSLQRCLSGDDMHSLFLVPVTTGELVTGVLGITLSQSGENLSSAYNEMVSQMALDLVNLTQYAAFLDQSRTLVATEERNRLARDLHDSVTQVLFSASLVAEVLPQIWRRDPDRAMQSLAELRRLTRGALAEMRTMLLELRPAAMVKTPLHELLAQLTEATLSRVQLSFNLFIERIPPLPKDVHANFYRIAQEALNNVTKHAQASQVILSLSASPLNPEQTGLKTVEITLIIEDDGVGFSPQNDFVENLGLGIMRERAADIEATLTIDSQTGIGTRVTLFWCGPVENKS